MTRRAIFHCLLLVLINLVPNIQSQAQAVDKPHDVVLATPSGDHSEEGVVVPKEVSKRSLALWEPEGKRIYHGVCINAENAAAFPEHLRQYTEIVGGNRPAVLVQFAHAYDKDHPITWDYYAKILQTLDKQTLMPFLKATTQSWDNRNLATSGLFFRADDILAGKHDAFFIKAAQVCKNFSKPIIMSWDHEMNGDWYSYSELRANREVKSDWTAEKYIQFHRRVWKIFHDQGATNVAFAFAPCIVGRRLRDFDERHSWKAYWPGDEYVDWIAPSYYNNERPDDLDVIASETNKPIFISEWGTSANREKWYRPQPYPGDQAWMTKTLEFWMHRYPNVKGSAYYQWEPDYFIQRNPEQVVPYVRNRGSDVHQWIEKVRGQN